MDLITALAICIGVLGGVATYVLLSPFGFGLQIWAAFIGWASFYHCGGKTEGLTSSALANLWGVLWGALTLIAVTATGMADTVGLPVWAGICVAVGVGLMILGRRSRRSRQFQLRFMVMRRQSRSRFSPTRRGRYWNRGSRIQPSSLLCR